MCQGDAGPSESLPVDGWCYVDAMVSPPLGNPEIVDACPQDERRLTRFVGAGSPTPGSVLYMTCPAE